MPGVPPSQKKDVVPPFAEFHEVSVCPFLHPVKVTLNGNTALWYTSYFSLLCIFSKLVQDVLSTINQFINKDFKQISFNTSPWGTLLLAGLHLDFTLLFTTLWAQQSSQFQFTSLSTYLAHTSSMCLQGHYRRRVRSTAKVKVTIIAAKMQDTESLLPSAPGLRAETWSSTSLRWADPGMLPAPRQGHAEGRRQSRLCGPWIYHQLEIRHKYGWQRRARISFHWAMLRCRLSCSPPAVQSGTVSKGFTVS